MATAKVSLSPYQKFPKTQRIIVNNKFLLLKLIYLIVHPKTIPFVQLGSSAQPCLSAEPCWQSHAGRAMLAEPCWQSHAGRAMLAEPCWQSHAGRAMLAEPCWQSHAGRAMLAEPCWQSHAGRAMLAEPC